MPYFAQKNYSDQLGYGVYTIRDAGCLLTSISNLLLKWGIAMAPPQLNQWYKAHNCYVNKDNLTWNSISVFDPIIHFHGDGGTNMPPSPDAIVKFHYQSIEHPYVIVDGREIPNMIDHFCAVDRIVDGELFIIDSWDGLIKAPTQYESAYHKPVGWAVYTKDVPPPPAPAPPPPPVVAKPVAPPSAPLSIPAPSEVFVAVKSIPGYMTSNQAANHINSNSTVPAGRYAVYNKVHGMVNITRVPGRPGWWINPADNIEAQQPIPMVKPPIPAVVPSPVVAAPVHTEPPAPKPGSDAPNWRSSWKAHEATYYALENMTIKDLAGQRKDLYMRKYDMVNIAGTFNGPDGVLYGRTKHSRDSYWWYGIPMNSLMLEDEMFSTTTDTATRQVVGTMTVRDHLVVGVGMFGKWLERWSSKQTAKK